MDDITAQCPVTLITVINSLIYVMKNIYVNICNRIYCSGN